MGLFRDRRQRIHDRAGKWLVKMRGEPGERDRRRFLRWYNADPSHAEAYDSQSRFWDETPGVNLTSPLADPVAIEAARSPAPQRYALAAALVAAIGLAAFLFASDGRRPTEPAAHEMLLLATAVGELREVPLGEGSRLILDTDSEVRMAPDCGRLELRRGRARVDAARGAGSVRLQAGAALVEAEGAVFDVRLEDGSAIVTPVSGVIIVRTPGAEQTPETRLAGRQSLAVLAAGEVRLRAGPDRSAKWPSGMLEFDGASLGDVVAEANRYGRRKIRLAGPRLGSLRVTGAYRAGDMDGLARSLAEAFGLDLVSAPDGDLLLRPRSG